MNNTINNLTDAFILCGGLGTRFLEVDKKIPKSLALVSQKPLLEWIILDLVDQGFKRIVLGTGHKSDQIEEYVKYRWSNFCIISKEEYPLGTAGAIKNAYNIFRTDQVLVLNGDSYIKYVFKNIINFNSYNNYDVSILLSSSTYGKDYGNVTISKENKILSFKEKNQNTQLVNSGVYCITKDLIKTIKSFRTCSLELDMIPKWINEKKIFGLVIDEAFLDIGVPSRYYNANIEQND